MGFSKLVYILFLLRHKGGRKKEKTEEGDKGVFAKCYKKAGREKKREAKVDKVVGVERCKKAGTICGK